MKTTMEKAGQVQRKWYIIDATGKSVGRVAAQAASILRGKEKVTYVQMTADKAVKVVTDHLVNGKVVAEYTVGAVTE